MPLDGERILGDCCNKIRTWRIQTQGLAAIVTLLNKRDPSQKRQILKARDETGVPLASCSHGWDLGFFVLRSHLTLHLSMGKSAVSWEAAGLAPSCLSPECF